MKKEAFIALLKEMDIIYTETEKGIEVKGDLELSSLTTLPEGVTLSAGGGLDLRSLTALPEGVTLSAGGGLYLGSLTTLPEGVTLSAGGDLYLDSLTALPEGVTFEKANSIRIDSLVGKHRYQGRLLEFKTIDGMTVIILSSHSRDGILIEKARYFGGGDIDRLQACYIASADGLHAHGGSIAEAVSDLAFKRLQNSADISEIIAEVKRTGEVSRHQYRLLTGACKEGCRRFLADKGVSEETETLPLAEVLKMTAGAYGGEKFRQLFEGVKA